MSYQIIKNKDQKIIAFFFQIISNYVFFMLLISLFLTIGKINLVVVVYYHILAKIIKIKRLLVKELLQK